MPKEWSIKIVFGSTSARLLVGVTTTITVASDITSSSVKSDHECKRRNADLAAPRLPAVQLTRGHPGIVEADLRCRRTRLIREGCPTRHAKGFPDRLPRLEQHVRKIEEPRHEADDDKRVGKIEIFRWHGWAPVLFGHKNACACPHSIDLPQRPAALMAKEFYGGSAPRMSNCDAGF